LAAFSLAAQTKQPVIFPGDDAQSLKLVWPATPGVRYEVMQSTDLQTWATAPGYPATAFGPAQQMPFQPTANAGFFKVNQLDDQPPAIVSQYPPDGGFAVPLFANLTMQLSDATGIDTNSIQLTVGSLGTFTLTSAQLTFSNNLLTFLNDGSNPLGGWSSNVLVTLVMADTLGNITTNTWSFTLESQPLVVTNLFVFGSPQAQKLGQRIGNIPTAELARRLGPVPLIPAPGNNPWTLSVESNCLLLSYTNTAPGFTVGQYVCNLTPASPAEIFNRKITSISDDPGNKLLTLFTVEVPITEIVTNGSVSISSDSMILQMGPKGAFANALSIGGTVTFPTIGYSLDGAEFTLRQDGFDSTINGVTFSVGSAPDLVHVTADQLHWWLTPQLQAGLDINWGGLQHFQAIASGTVNQAAVWDADVILAGADAKQTIFELPPGAQPQMWMLVGYIGPFPVFATLDFNLKLVAEENAQAVLSFHAGETQTVNASFGLTYNSPNDVEWVHDFNFPPPAVEPFTGNINGVGSVKLSLEPEVDFLVYGLAGVSAGVTPSASVVIQAGTSQPLTGDLDADVSLDISPAGPALEPLNLPDFSLSLWSDEWHLFPNPATATATAITFDQQPASQTVAVGGSANFSCAVTASGTPSYQWYFNSMPMPGQTSRALSLANVNSGYAGNYYVQVSAGGQTTNSATATLTVLPASIQSGKSGLVAWYPLNGNANDASGNGNNGTPNDVAFVVDRFGVASGAASFAGINFTSFISIPFSENFNYSPNGQFTISTWVAPQVNGDWNSIFVKGNTDWDYGLVITPDTRQFAVGMANFLVLSTTTAIPSTWYFVTGTYSNGCWRIYVNGNLEGENLNGKLITQSGFGAAIGVKGVYGSNAYRGAIDDLRIYNRALSASEILSLYNSGLPAPAPSSGMALIPAGSFTMGNCMNPNEGWSDEMPLHSVYVSAFYMDKYDVTYSLWQQVYTWATNHGYGFDNAGSGKAANHPVQTINWYDAVKWCNARSEMEGRTPAYYTDATLASVYRSGELDISNSCVNWNAGYRLPTEAEWEKAARGGASGQRFPWGNTINESQANYSVDLGYFSYDVNPYSGCNAAYANGSYPYTSPVGSFAPNGYGLYDMAGNVWQWCWDWCGDYSSGSQTDPRGPTTGQYGSNRELRGGSWSSNALYCRTAGRDDAGFPAHSNYADYGFRSVLPPGQ
jgi:formylglycine-generating enzyme required for sulfatase activity